MEQVAANMTRAIHRILDGIEEYPRMYGSLEAIELQYVTLLGVLASGYGVEHTDVRDIVLRVSFARLGGKSNTPMFSLPTEVELLAGLKEIRAEVEKLLQP